MPNERPWQVNNLRALCAVGYFRISANTVTEGDTISIAGRTYEFHNGAVPVAGDVAIDMSAHGAGLWNSADAVAHAVAAINGDALRTVAALAIGVSGAFATLLLQNRTAGATNPALLNTVDATACIWPSAANMVGGTAESVATIVPGRYTMTVQDVLTLADVLGTTEIVIGMYPMNVAPRLIGVMARRAGAVVALTDGIFTFRQVNGLLYALCYAEPAAGALLANGDVIDFLLSVPAS
jgi:hypothetical protein